MVSYASPPAIVAWQDKALPADIPAEEGTLGALLLDRDGITQVVDFLKPGHFLRESHGLIYAAIHALYTRREPPDLITLQSELTRRGHLDAIGGPAALVGLMDRCPSHTHVLYYGQSVLKAAKNRHRITIGGKLAGLAYDTELDEDAKSREEDKLWHELHADDDRPLTNLAKVWDQNLSDIAMTATGTAPGTIPTGFTTLDAALGGGWARGELIIPAALTSRGKSALGVEFARAAAQAGYRVLMVSLEAKKEALGMRFLANAASVEKNHLRAGTLSDADWGKLATTVADADDWARRILFSDTPMQTVAGISTAVFRAQATPGSGCDLLIVDYLQLLSGDTANKNRVQELAGISRGLKLLAMDANIPIIAPSQLSREAVGNDEPKLHHLRDSGALEQDAAVVLFLHRPNPADPARVDLLLAKQRDGAAELAIPLRWHGAYQQFREVNA